ncbi:MAG: hypothetical protein ABSC72_04920 [Methylovirgula sp.]|jgi:hypothetical protein
MSLTAPQYESSDAPTMAMRDVADRIGNELAELAGAIHRLQILISPLLNEAALRNPAHLQELQDIDHIYQKVGNLAEFLAALALTLPKDWVLDPSTASQAITLSALASRLGFIESTEPTAKPLSGDCDFF